MRQALLTYSQANLLLSGFSNYEKKSHILKPAFSLSGELGLLRALGAPHKAYPCIHVAGTVGKGSVCIMLESILRSAGYRTGLYTSPHITDVRERIRFCGAMISKKDFAETASAVLGRGKADPEKHTYFEVMTAMAFEYFRSREADIAVIETGLGGRLDCTNTVPPFLSVITRIGKDHTHVLGRTPAAIAEEKAGIIKRSAPAVALHQTPIVNRVLEAAAAAKHSPLHFASPSEIPPMDIPLALTPSFQKENIAVALKAVEVLQNLGYEIGDRHIAKGLKSAKPHARFEKHPIPKGCGAVIFVMDAGHNPPAAEALRKELDALRRNYARIILVAGMMKDKDAAAFLRAIAPAADEILCPEIGNSRAFSSKDFAGIAHAEGKSATLHKTVGAALDAALASSSPGDIICLAGSFYMLSEGTLWLHSKTPTAEKKPI